MANRSGHLLSVLVGSLVVLAPAGIVADTKLTVTFYSDPAGATIYQGGQTLGVAPSNLRYVAPGKFKECIKSQPLKVRWVSSAEVELADLLICPAAGKKQQFTVFRPNGLPGLELDAQYAIALLQQRHAAQLAQQAEWAASLAAMQQQLLQRPKHCTSSVIGNQVFTNCY